MAQVKILNSFEILFSKPLTQFDTPTAKAYSVSRKGHSSSSYFALVCPLSPVLPRLLYLEKILSFPQEASKHLLLPIHAEFVSLPREQTEFEGPLEESVASATKLALIFQDPQAKRLNMENLEPWPEEAIYETLLPAAIDALTFLEKEGLTHRSICVDNLFVDFSQKEPRVVFGEFVSTLPAFSQPSAFEPLSSALAVPFARGDQTIQADLYALGVTILALMKGGNPCPMMQSSSKELSEDKGSIEGVAEHLIFQKMQLGSFDALQNRAVFSNRLTELLKGLLSDKKNWDLEDLRSWLGQGKAPALVKKTFSASKTPLLFRGQRIYTLQALAAAFRAHPLEACDFLRDRHLFCWLDKRIEQKEMGESIQLIVKQFFKKSPHLLNIQNLIQDEDYCIALEDIFLVDALITQVCQELDPESGVLLCAGLPMHIDGLKDAMTTFLLSEQPLDPFQALFGAESFQQHLEESSWIQNIAGAFKSSPQMACEAVQQSPQILKALLRESLFAEHHFHSLWPHLPCLSPLYPTISTAYDLAKAFEEKAEKLSLEGADFLPSFFIDKHILAFLSAHEPTLRGVCQQWSESTDNEDQLLAFFLLLEQLQVEVYKAPMPNLGKLLTFASMSLVERCRNKDRRNILFYRLQHFAFKGELAEMRRLLTTGEELEKDRTEFQSVKMDLLLIHSEIKMIENYLHHMKSPIIKQRAMQASVSFFCTLITSSYLLLRFWPL